MKPKFSDTELLQLLGIGDKHSFSLLYDSYMGLMYNYGCRLCTDKELVKDAMQDVFVDIWCRRGKLSKIDSLKAYLLKSLRYKIQRKLKKSISSRLESAVWMNFAVELSEESTIILDETLDELNQRLKKCINLLPNQQREVIFHVFYHHLNYSEVAAVMSLSKKTVYNLMHTALEKLRMTMKNTPCLTVVKAVSYLLFFHTLILS